MNIKVQVNKQTVVRLALVGIIPPLLILLFLWAGGWLTPERLTSGKLATVLQQSGGVHQDYRRNHAKGMCVLGSFISNGNASTLSRVLLFSKGEAAVIGRLAIAGGNPAAPDYTVPVRSMTLSFTQANDEQWRTGMNAMPFFPVSSVESFYKLQTAMLPDARTGKLNPEKVNAFVMSHPEIKPSFVWAEQYIPSSNWASDRFNSPDAFRLIDQAGNEHLVRWSMVPHTRFIPISDIDKQNKDFLQQDLQQRLEQGTLEWDLVSTLTQADDRGNDSTKVWPADRKTTNAGTLVLNKTIPQQQRPCNDINYDPLILPDGIAASDGPILNACSSVYARSYNLRMHEQAQQTGEHL